MAKKLKKVRLVNLKKRTYTKEEIMKLEEIKDEKVPINPNSILKIDPNIIDNLDSNKEYTKEELQVLSEGKKIDSIDDTDTKSELTNDNRIDPFKHLASMLKDENKMIELIEKLKPSSLDDKEKILVNLSNIFIKKYINNFNENVTDLLKTKDKHVVSTILSRLNNSKPKKDSEITDSIINEFDDIIKSKESLILYIIKFVPSFVNHFINENTDLVNGYFKDVYIKLKGIEANEVLGNLLSKYPDCEKVINKMIELIGDVVIYLDRDKISDIMNFTSYYPYNKDDFEDECGIPFLSILGGLAGELLERTINVDDTDVRIIFIKLGLIEPKEFECEILEEEKLDIEYEKESKEVEEEKKKLKKDTTLTDEELKIAKLMP